MKACFAVMILCLPATAWADDYLQAATEQATAASQKGNHKEAVEIATAAIDKLAEDKRIWLDDEIGPLYAARGKARLALKQYDRAASDLRKSVDIWPEDVPTLLAASSLFASAPDDKVRDGEFALKAAERALNRLEQRKGDLAARYRALATACRAAAKAEMGEFRQAVQHQRYALRELTEMEASWRRQFADSSGRVIALFLGEEFHLDDLANELKEHEQRLESYREQKPHRLPAE